MPGLWKGWYLFEINRLIQLNLEMAWSQAPASKRQGRSGRHTHQHCL